MRSLADYPLKKDLVAEMLRDAITSGALTPGKRIVQEDIARRLDVSWTPVREAMRELERDGLLVHAPHKGVSVAELTAAQIREIYMIRAILESKAAEIATPNLDQEAVTELEALHQQYAAAAKEAAWRQAVRINRAFHMRVYSAAKSPILFRIIDRLWTRIPWAYVGHTFRAQEITQEHGRILSAIGAGDPISVADAVREHIEIGCNRVAGHLEKQHG